MTHPMTHREKAFFWASLYLGMLFFSCIIMWWVVIIGGNPFSITNAGAYDTAGNPSSRFRPGQIVHVRSLICTSRAVALEYYPSLDAVDTDQDVHYPLFGGIIKPEDTLCHEHTVSFIVPNLPAGPYTFKTTYKFQNNLIGRDESGAFPSVDIWIER